MADRNCRACDELKVDAPNLIVNGITSTECASLKNNTGLNPSSGNDDCTDLDNMNDCLVGNMEAEIEAYDVCEWKPFMKRFIPNVWTTLKGIICAVCGLWTNLASLWAEINGIKDRLSVLCAMITAQVAPKGNKYGVFPRRTTPYGACGTIPTISGSPALIDLHYTGHGANDYTGVGIEWGAIDSINCSSGAKSTLKFWEPYVYGYGLNPNVSIGDALWVATKSELQALIPSMDNAWWQTYTDESWTWTTGIIEDGQAKGKNIWLRFKVGDAGYSNNHLVLTYQGTSYPDTVPSDTAPLNMTNESEFRWM